MMRTRNQTNASSGTATGRRRQNSLSDSSERGADSDSSGEPGMFSGLTAWYSTSVKDSTIKSWVDGDGELVTSDTAMFLFSEDAEAADTKRIFESEAYTNEFVSIFHADVMSEFLRQGHVKNVAIGKYFLPPKEVHDVIKQQVSFKWEMNAQRARPAKPPGQHKSPSPHKDQTTASTIRSPSSDRVEDVRHSNCDATHQAAPVGARDNRVTAVASQSPQASSLSHPSMEPQPQPSTSQATEPEASTSQASVCHTGTMKQSQMQQSAASLTHPSTTAHQSRKRVAIDEESSLPVLGYIDIGQFPKVKGELNDFTFGQHGCQVINK